MDLFSYISLKEAYRDMYAPTKAEPSFEEVESWVLSLVEEGADFSDFTWEEASYAYQEYLSEKKKDDPLDMASHPGLAKNKPGNEGKSGRDLVGTGVTPGSKEDRAKQNQGKATVAPGGRQYAPPTSSSSSSSNKGGGKKDPPATYNQDKFDSALGALKKTINMANSGSGKKDDSKGGDTKKDDPQPSTQQPSTQQQSRQQPPSSQQPSRSQPSTSTSTSSSSSTTTRSKATPAAPPKDRMADKSKEERMAAWAKANPKLAAAKKKRDETRGTNKSTNPLLTKDMRARMPSPKKSSTPPASTSRISQATSGIKSRREQQAAASKNTSTPAPSKNTSTPASSKSTPAPSRPVTTSSAPATGKSALDKLKKFTSPSTKKEEYDDFDIILSHLIESGFGDDEALAIMSTMSSEKREEILKKI